MTEHVARIDYEEFFVSAFRSEVEARAFVKRVEATDGQSCSAKIILHQTARLLWLGDKLGEFAAGRPAMQILFLIIAAETVAKLRFEFNGEGESKKHVRRFFEEICSDDHRELLGRAFTDGLPPRAPVDTRRAVDMLYAIRCDVVHRGEYYSLSLKASEHAFDMLTEIDGQMVVVHTTVNELRSIVLEGGVLATAAVLADCERMNTSSAGGAGVA